MSTDIIKKSCDIIKYFEGFREKSYQDEGSVWTIGYGTTKNIKENQKINKSQALKLLEVDVVQRYNKLCKLVDIGKFKECEVVAILSFLYNLGFVEAFIKHLITYDKDLIPSKMLLYNKIRINGVLVLSEGLKKRRVKEYNIFKGLEIV